MKRLEPGVLTEMLPVFLVLASIGGTFGIVLTVHQRIAERSRTIAAPRPVPVLVPDPPSAPPPAQTPEPPPPVVVVAPPPAPPPAPAPPAEDPTKKALAVIASELASQRTATAEADRRTRALMKARLAAEAEARRWSRREAIVRSQAAELTDKAEALEREADALALERDALAMQVKESKSDLEKVRRNGGGYAVLPHRAQNGTWQRPVVIECRDGLAILQPRGQSFTMLDLSGLLGVRSSPLVAAVAQEMIRIQEVTSPDGSPVVPYIYFIVRPDGIRPFYEARARLEPLGIAFGYELVEQDWEIAFPDADTWDAEGITKPKHQPGGGANAGFAWPADRQDAQKGRESNPFLWPSTRNAPEGGGQVLLEDFDRLNPSGDRGGTGRRGLSTDSRAPAGLGEGETRGFGPRPATPPGGGLARGPSTEGREGPSGPGLGPDPGTASRRGGPGISGRPDDPGSPGSPSAPSGGGPGPGNLRNGGLSPIEPDGLPRFDAVGGGGSGNDRRPSQRGTAGWTPEVGGLPGLHAGGLAGAGASGVMPKVPSALSGVPPEVAGRLASSGVSPQLLGLLARAAEKEGRTPTAPDGRVRINASQLAAAESDADEPNEPNEGGSTIPEGNGVEGPQGSPGQGQPGSGSAPRAGEAPRVRGGTTSGNPFGSPSSGSAGGNGLASPSGRPMPMPLSPGGVGGTRGQGGMASRRGSGADSSASSLIEAPLELTVVCGPEGVILHPGGYRISLATLRKDKGLELDLRTIVRNHSLIDATVRPLPRLEYLIEPGGEETYLEARKQLVLSGLDWPVTIRSSTGGLRSHFAREPF